MEFQRILQSVSRRTGLSMADAERLVQVTLKSLAERLLPLDATFLAQELPEPLASYLHGREQPGEFDLEEFFMRVADREGVSLEFGVEHAKAVCISVAEELEASARHMLRARLPEAFADLLTPSGLDEHETPYVGHHPDARRGTLATGRPGSNRPLSEASADRSQTQSVARSENPHGDSKLSSARGIKQEREERTLAAGHAGPEHPIAEDD